VRFIPARFTPTASVFANKECGGVQILVTDRRSVNAVELGIEIARALQSLYSEGLAGRQNVEAAAPSATLSGVKELKEVSAIRTSWVETREKFAQRREKYLIYP
jgi:uncharacterized protein YbbC (DUF1343 family)